MSITKDPVCGMTVLPERSLREQHGGETVYLCSEFCRARFLTNPERYASSLVAATTTEGRSQRRIAYFSMEVAVGREMHTYSGGLGVLAGDTVKAAADLRVPMVGVSLLSRKGYFRQTLDAHGNQSEAAAGWEPDKFLTLLSDVVEVAIEGRQVRLQAWQSDVVGATGYVVPVLFLDSDFEGNTDYDRALTDHLYAGDEAYRLAQECVLGIGGVRMLRALGFTEIDRYHMNEGHASLLALELLRERSKRSSGEWDYDAVRRQCIFTTHTPIPAGHDQFDYGLVGRIVGEPVPRDVVRMLGGKDRLNMTLLGFNLSGYVNGVAKRHEEVSREMFPAYPIEHITNGVHSWTWTSVECQAVFDRHVSGWRTDAAMLRKAIQIPKEEIWDAHAGAKERLLIDIRRRTGRSLSSDALTIGFARRATAYKRADLVFTDVERLRTMARQRGRIQFVFAGKAHPQDEPGKELIRKIVRAAHELGDDVPVVYLEEYDLELAKMLVSGVDLWLNTPEPPKEASGTSGMKAAHNGVPSLSTLDGWWLEGHVEGLTGWSIGGTSDAELDNASQRDADDLYRKMEATIVPLFHDDRSGWTDVMRHTIALNASYFNTQRMLQQYVTSAYIGS